MLIPILVLLLPWILKAAAAGVPEQVKPLAQNVPVWLAAAAIEKVPLYVAVDGVRIDPKANVPPPVS